MPRFDCEVTLPEPEEERERSPAALRYDPPLVKVRAALGEAWAWPALLDAVEERLAGTGAHVAAVLRHGGLHLDGRPVDHATPPSDIASGTRLTVYGLVREPEVPPLPSTAFVAEGPGWVAVDKPAWMPMQRTRASSEGTLEGAVRETLGDPSLIAVHRLDRTTSGVALFARGRETASRIQGALGDRRAEKRYLAVVGPPPARDAFEVEGWIGRKAHPRRFAFAMQGGVSEASLDLARQQGIRPRHSRTRFTVLARHAGSSLVEARPVTGRTHQLRVHLAHVGSPILGDELYGAPWVPGAPERTLLHAARLEVDLGNGQTFVAEAPTPEDLRAASPGAC